MSYLNFSYYSLWNFNCLSGTPYRTSPIGPPTPMFTHCMAGGLKNTTHPWNQNNFQIINPWNLKIFQTNHPWNFKGSDIIP